jgi:hypothetical protein
LETRIKIMEEESRDSFDISKFYVKPPDVDDSHLGEKS